MLCSAKEMVAVVRSGDAGALDRMTACYGDRLLAVGRRVCDSEQDAADAVQDAWEAAGTHLASFRGDGSVEGWLVRMVKNACHRMRRGRKNDPALHIYDVDLHAADDGPETLAGRGELAIAIGEALAGLSPTDRLVLILAEGKDWTGPEIAAELGLTAGAVRSRLTRSRKRMRAVLSERLEIGQF